MASNQIHSEKLQLGKLQNLPLDSSTDVFSSLERSKGNIRGCIYINFNIYGCIILGVGGVPTYEVLLEIFMLVYLDPSLSSRACRRQ